MINVLTAECLVSMELKSSTLQNATVNIFFRTAHVTYIVRQHLWFRVHKNNLGGRSAAHPVTIL